MNYDKNIALGVLALKVLIFNCSPVRNGATAEICSMAERALEDTFDVKSLCIDDHEFAFCKGCRGCHKTAECVIDDDIPLIMEEFERADVILAVSPSYWADVPGQFKAFIDRCTPWCNTHEPHLSISKGKKGYMVALRTGPNMAECERIIQTIGHFYGHLEIESRGTLGLCSVESKEDVKGKEKEILALCQRIKEDMSHGGEG